MVVVGHASSFTKTGAAFSPPNFVWLQNIGVVLFFIVSGFLICKTTADNLTKARGSYTFMSFLLDRATRIYCGLLPALAVICVIDIVQYTFLRYIHAGAFNLQTLFANILFLQDYPRLPFTSFGSGRQLWTLAVEWWLYIAFGSVFLPWPKNRLVRLLLLALTIVAVPVALTNLVHGRGDGLAAMWIIGAAGVWVLPRSSLMKASATLGFFGIAAGFLFRDARLVEYDFHFNVVFAFCVIGLVGVLNASSRPVWGPLNATAHYGAGYSYTLYLTHYSILELMNQLPGVPPYALLVADVITCNLVAAAVAQLGERKYKTARIFLRKRLLVRTQA
jgi:peptidoglycan/LPS O-acetylase OafA/YrhL